MPLTSVLNWLKVKIFMTVILKTAKSSTREARNNVALSQFLKRCLKTKRANVQSGTTLESSSKLHEGCFGSAG